MEVGATTAEGLDAAATTGVFRARRPNAESTAAMLRQPTSAHKPDPGATSKDPVSTTPWVPLPSGTGNSFEPMNSKAEHTRPPSPHPTAANPAPRLGITDVTSPRRVEARRTIAAVDRNGSRDGAIGPEEPGTVVVPAVFFARRKFRALSATVLSGSGTVSVALSCSGRWAEEVSEVAGSEGMRSMPKTRSWPRITSGSRSPTRMEKKTRKKHPVASAKAIAAVHAGKPLPLTPSDTRMLAGGPIGLKVRTSRATTSVVTQPATGVREWSRPSVWPHKSGERLQRGSNDHAMGSMDQAPVH